MKGSSYAVTFDGGYDSTSGRGGSGHVVYSLPEWKVLTFGFAFSADGASNNVEEYRGMIAGLRAVTLLSASEDDSIVVLGDSQLVINQVIGHYNCGENLAELLDTALTFLHPRRFICRWIPREWNEAADLLSREARRLRHWQNPLQARSMEEWRSQLRHLTATLIERSATLGTPTSVRSRNIEVEEELSDRLHKMMISEMSFSLGNRRVSCMQQLKPWKEVDGSALKGTRMTGLGHTPRWTEAAALSIRVRPTAPHILSSAESTDMNAVKRAADSMTDLIRRNAWDIGKTVRDLRKEEEMGRPNMDLDDELYQRTLQGYPELGEMRSTAKFGVGVELHHNFKSPRPWPKNFPIATEAMPVAAHKIVDEYNKGRGIFANAGPLGRNCKYLTISPMGAVKKGEDPISENVRIILGLSSPKGNSINSNTVNDVPDACFGKVTEIADKVLRLRHEMGMDVKIMAATADIDAAFKHVPKASHSVERFGIIIPGTNIVYLSFNLDFGWTGSPGYFALFAKAVRYAQSRGGSFVRDDFKNFYSFVWVDDIVLVEPDVDNRLYLAELHLRTKVEEVFGPTGWKESKFETWSSSWKALGLLWDSSNCTVEMPINKLVKAADAIQATLIQGRTTVGALRSLLGQLRHLATCVPAARAFVQEIQQMVNLARDRPAEAVLNICPEASTDLHFWQENIRSTDFTEWPMELFGTVCPDTAVWTIGIINGHTMVHWHETALTWMDPIHEKVCFASSVRAICSAFTCWLEMLKSLKIRAPRIRVLVARATWATAINGGRNGFVGGRHLMQTLAKLQLQHRVHFIAVHWKASGNAIRPEWRRIVRAEECNTNVSPQIGSQHRVTHGTEIWLCNQCALALARNTRNGLNHGRNLPPRPTFRFGLTPTTTMYRPSISRGILHSWHAPVSTRGPQLRGRSEQYAGCTACSAKLNWSANMRSSPWWAMDVNARSHALGPGNQ